MKTIRIELGLFDGEAVLMDAKKLADYPDTCKATLEVKHDRLTAGIILAADAALNKRRDLFQENPFDGSLKAGVSEGFAYARAVEIITRTAKEWSLKSVSGDLIESLSEFDDKAIQDQSPSLITVIASRIEFPVLPTAEEMNAEKNA